MKNIIALTLKAGSFKYINALLDQENLIFCKATKQITVSGKTFVFAATQQRTFSGGQLPNKASIGLNVKTQSAHYWKIIKLIGLGLSVFVPIVLATKTNSRFLPQLPIAAAMVTHNAASIPPLAMIPNYLVLPNKKLIKSPSRVSSVPVKALQGPSLNHSNRRTVISFFDGAKANALISSGKEGSVKAIVFKSTF